MIKKLCIILLSVCTVAPLSAQQYSSSDDASFAPKKGQWQVSMVFGSSQMFNNSTEDYLLPRYWDGKSALAPNIGIGNGSGHQSADPAYYLTLGDLNNNSLVNIIGVQGKYFLTDRWDINLMFSMNIGVTPKKDYIEGDRTVQDMQIPAKQYLEGKIKNNWSINIGSNYYFNTKNERINLYVGGLLGWQMGRIQTTTPYTGIMVEDPDMSTDDADAPGGTDLNPSENPNSQDNAAVVDGSDVNGTPLEVYIPNTRTGRIFGLRAASVAGIEYSLGKGLILGFEVQPVAYRYDMIQICPKGMSAYKVGHHNINLFALPNLKLGFRF